MPLVRNKAVLLLTQISRRLTFRTRHRSLKTEDQYCWLLTKIIRPPFNRLQWDGKVRSREPGRKHETNLDARKTLGKDYVQEMEAEQGEMIMRVKLNMIQTINNRGKTEQSSEVREGKVTEEEIKAEDKETLTKVERWFKEGKEIGRNRRSSGRRRGRRRGRRSTRRRTAFIESCTLFLKCLPTTVGREDNARAADIGKNCKCRVRVCHKKWN